MAKKAVLIDNDGCCQCHCPDKGYGDPEDHYYAAFEAIALTFGKHLDKNSALRRQVMGIDIRNVGRLMIDGLSLPITHEEWQGALDQILLALAPFAEPAPGCHEFLLRLRESGIRVGIASSSMAEILVRKWQRFPETRQLFDCMVAGNDPRVARGKPEPDLLLVAAQDLGVTPAGCVYIGDSKSDVLAAKAAGMMSIAVPSGGRPRSDYEQAGADVIVDSLLESMPYVL